jgi:hypothetical protein
VPCRVDIDWEYPGDETRGGRPQDKDNYPLLIQELRAALDATGRPLLLTLAIGASWTGAAGGVAVALHACHRPRHWGLLCMVPAFHGQQAGWQAGA